RRGGGGSRGPGRSTRSLTRTGAVAAMTAKISPSKGSPYARILGVGGYRPTRVVPNEVILEHIDSSDEWIRTRSGIASRHWAGPDETVAEMSLAAGGKAIADAGIDASDIDGVVVATVSHFKQT